MTSPSGLWRLSEGEDEVDGGGAGKEAGGTSKHNEDDDTDRAVEESLSTDDEDDKRVVSFHLDDLVDTDASGRVRRNTVREADEAEGADK